MRPGGAGQQQRGGKAVAARGDRGRRQQQVVAVGVGGEHRPGDGVDLLGGEVVVAPVAAQHPPEALAVVAEAHRVGGRVGHRRDGHLVQLPAGQIEDI